MLSRRNFALGGLGLLLSACSSRQIVTAIEGAARSGSLEGAVRSVATSQAQSWARNPQSLANDLENLDGFFKKFVDDVVRVWGQDNTVTPSEKVFVKYGDDYHSRGIIDFDKGIARVETLKPEQLKQAIITMVLSPEDPTNMDLFSSQPATLGGEPFLFDQVLDQDKKAIRWAWRAGRFADYVMKTAMGRKTITRPNGSRAEEVYVEFPLVKNHTANRQNKYAPLVTKYSAQNNIQRALTYAIIETESHFNPYAVSWVPAYGLMQIVPKTAGRDAYEVIHGRKGTPSRTYLFDPNNNIRMGTTYLKILYTRYLKDVRHPLSKEYCVIAAYNGGAGNVLRSFSANRTNAFRQINRMSPDQVYQRLRAKMPKESQDYLVKVLKAKKRYA